MLTVVLAATHDRLLDASGREVPAPLFTLDDEPLLTMLLRRVSRLPGNRAVHVVTNEVLKEDLESWASSVPDDFLPVHVLSDDTSKPEDRLGAVGDLKFVIDSRKIDEDLLVIGGDNWFNFDLREFVERSRGHSPSVLVTPLRSGVRPSRFGFVECDEEGRVRRFLEKPETCDLGLKASCVYFFSAEDLRWFDTYARDHSTVCSPGTFLAWLVDQAPVWAVEMSAVWYDVGHSRAVTAPGPDLLQLQRLLRKIAGTADASWERLAAGQLQWVSSVEDVLEAIHDDKPNRRIVGAVLLGHAGDLVDRETVDRVIEELLGLLADGRQNQYIYGVSQSDEESCIFVSATAANALVRLGYAPTAEAVFRKARDAGFEVAECYNIE